MERERGCEGVDLLKAALKKNRAEYLFALDKLMSELVSPPAPTNDGTGAPPCSPESRVITLQSLNSFDRKLVHIMVGTTSQTEKLPHLMSLPHARRGRGTASRRSRTRASSSGLCCGAHAVTTRSSSSVW